MENRVKKLESEVQHIDGHVQELTVTVDKVDRTVTILEDRMESIDDAIDNVIEMKLDDRNREKEKEKRSKNVMKYNVPENEKKNEETLKCEMVNDIYTQCMGVENITPENVYKIGKGNKPRPVLVKFDSKEDWEKILKKAKELRKCDNRDLRKVFLKPDKTPNERERERKLLNELKTR